MKADKISLMVNLAKRGALQNSIRITTSQVAQELNVSQQTASRWLLELQNEGMIERLNGKISFTQNGRKVLLDLKEGMDALFEKSEKELDLYGRVVSGMREGRFYLSIPEYKKQIAKALGVEVYAGTLNLRLEGGINSERKRKLMDLPGIEIRGFQKNGRLLGGAKVFRAKLLSKRAQADGAVIIPLKSHYGTEILELISKDNLRRKLGLKNKDEVRVVAEL